ncbi:MAG: hypothetical protein CXR31_08365 [Geobacter sp.]|nr:MAG: hypothetical protein CXR31_08365 [Geobacter sp.]
MEKRQFKRLGYCAEADLSCNGKELRGSVENLSFRGLYFRSNTPLPACETADITVHFIGRASPLVINFHGAIAWRTERGIGMEFTRTDPRSFSRLKNILAYNYKEPEEFSDESRHCASILEHEDN